jgi:hypothetical protein
MVLSIAVYALMVNCMDNTGYSYVIYFCSILPILGTVTK